MAYSNRTTETTGSKPMVAIAPTAASRTAIRHSRAACTNRTAGVVAMTPSTADTTHVITAAPVRR